MPQRAGGSACSLASRWQERPAGVARRAGLQTFFRWLTHVTWSRLTPTSRLLLYGSVRVHEPRGVRVAQLPTGTVTFLFTDLEGSTRLWEEHPEAMRAALARHDEILRGAVTQRDGHVVKATGDGLHAAFAVAPDAVAAALDAQRQLLAEPWTLPEPLRVRMGLHTGVAEVRDGDYYGTSVNRAARVAAAAHGGQVVASAASADLVRDDIGPEITLSDLASTGCATWV